MAPPVRAANETIASRDGHPLAATVYEPEGAARLAVIVAPATGVKRTFYEPYARFLAARGCAVVTFDYRGIGGSRTGPIRRSTATIRDWGEKDYAAVVDWTGDRYASKVCLVGHSVGGQLVGLLDNVDRVAAVCTVAAQNAYYRRYPLRRALKYGLLWHLGVPLVTRAVGHFPARALRLGEDLPSGVALEWARFARHPDYLVDRRGRPIGRGFDTLEAPVLAFSFADDLRAPATHVRRLHERYRRARVVFRDVHPSAVGVPGIGHVGFFLGALRRTLWLESLTWLASATDAPAQAQVDASRSVVRA